MARHAALQCRCKYRLILLGCKRAMLDGQAGPLSGGRPVGQQPMIRALGAACGLRLVTCGSAWSSLVVSPVVHGAAVGGRRACCVACSVAALKLRPKGAVVQRCNSDSHLPAASQTGRGSPRVLARSGRACPRRPGRRGGRGSLEPRAQGKQTGPTRAAHTPPRLNAKTGTLIPDGPASYPQTSPISHRFFQHSIVAGAGAGGLSPVGHPNGHLPLTALPAPGQLPRRPDTTINVPGAASMLLGLSTAGSQGHRG